MPLSFPDDHAIGALTTLDDLIGRESEITTLLAVVQQRADRLITITGPGGVGKTRLALEVISRAEQDDAYDRIATATLASLPDATLLPATIAATLGVAETPDRPAYETLIAALTGQRWLLMLDNCEHLPTIGTFVARVLARCPDLVVLATSRAPLGIYGEREFPLSPLAVPNMSRLQSLVDITQQPAVALFLRRAQLINPNLVIDETNAGVIVEICRQLDGLPLAIELAAARVRVLPPTALLARLDQRLTLLTGGPRDRSARQQTLSGAIAWSYDLLTAPEQHLFRHLAIFAGGWTLTAAEAVAGEAGVDVLDGTEALARHSLIHRKAHPAHLPSFAMLESLRAFGLEHLDAEGELPTARDRHAAYVIQLARDAERDILVGHKHDHWLSVLDWEIDNLRWALTWLFDGDEVTEGLRLVGDLWSFWELRGHWVEGRTWLERALGLADTAAPDIRVRLLLGSGAFALRQGEYALASRRLEESQTLARRLGDRTLSALSLFVLGNVVGERPEPDYSLANSRCETALAMFRNLGQPYWVARVINSLGNIALAQGEAERAAAFYEEALALNRELGSTWVVASALGNLASSLVAQGQLVRAEEALRESVTISRTLGSRHMQSDALETLARIAIARGQYEHAVRLWGAAEGVRAGLGMALPTPDRIAQSQSVNAARERLSKDVFDATWAAGFEGANGDSMDALLDGQEQTSAATATTTPRESSVAEPEVRLSPREREILRLLVDGHSNQEIGETLFISPHTVARHVANILTKLDVESRTAAATYALRHGLLDT